MPSMQAAATPLGRMDRAEPAAINGSFQGRPLGEHWLCHDIAPLLIALVREIVQRCSQTLRTALLTAQTQ